MLRQRSRLAQPYPGRIRMSIFLFIVGLILLVLGAEWLVRGASRLAVMTGISPLVVGLTVVAFGTSAPEFAVTIKAALSGQADLSVGNVIGSNIFNVLFILGLSSIITPLIVARQLIRFDLPLVIGVSLMTFAMAFDRQFSALDGTILFAGLIIYTSGLIWFSRKKGIEALSGEAAEVLADAESGPIGMKWLKNLALVAGGMTMLALGSSWLVESSVVFANYLGVSEVVIGLTIVSIGTSLPEVVTSVVASLRNERDIAVGNVVGSNLFNLLGVLGLASILAPGGISVDEQVLWVDIPVMALVAIAAFPIFYTRGTISRAEGVLLFVYYLAYTMYILLNATGHAGRDPFASAILWGALPLTAIGLVIQTGRQWYRGKIQTPEPSSPALR